MSGERPPFLDLAPAPGARGEIALPGSKSISNRTLLLAALAGGATEVLGLLDSDDTARMLEALAKLGVRIERTGPTAVRVHGAGGRFPVKDADLFLGNAGTAFRPLTAVLALSDGAYRLSGVPRMHERPIGDLIDGLAPLGARVTYTGTSGYPPLAIAPIAPTGAAEVAVNGSVSSQFLTALLMAAPLLGRPLAIRVVGELISKPYIEITLNMMARFGVEVAREGWSRFVVPAGAAYRSPGRIHVEGDASSASYFLAAGALGVGPVRVTGVGRDSIQGDIRFVEALQAMGADVTMGEDWVEARGIAAAYGERLRAIDGDFNHIPDAAMTLATLALFAEGPSTLRNIGSWRVKETDRIAAMVAELTKVGARVEAGADYLRITPPERPRHAAIDTYDDHRVAMCFSLVALGGVGVRINDPMCVAKTFPDYFDVFAKLTRPGPPVIAIDGPSASGKGTVAQRVAAALGMSYLDSGALYRIVAVKALRAGVPLEEEPAVASLARDLDVRFAGDEVLLDGTDESPAIRSEAAGAGASKVAALPAVRAALLGRQRAFRGASGVVADGRDIGSVVFPDAKLKVFLVAAAETRAERRHKQLQGKGIESDVGEILAELKERDRRDSTRAVAPLKQMPDAKLLDTTSLSIDEAVARVLEWYRAAG